jgi:hypothetical protein
MRLALDPVGTGPHWLKRFRSAAWLIYITEKELVSSGSAPAPDFVVEVGPSVRDMLVGSGLTRQRKPLRMKLRQRATKLEAEAIGNGVCVVWMDNYNRQRSSKNPGVRRNQSINGTAIAKLPIKVGANPWTSQPSIKDMFLKVDATASGIVSMQKTFINSVRDLELLGMSYDDVRVPCDVRRRGVTSAGWIPHDVREGNIGSLEGLVMALTLAKQQQQRRGVTQPLLSDVNIFYRTLKLMYGVTFSEHNVRGVMDKVPLLFGVWHAYAHCVKRCYAVFKSFWASLEYKEMLGQPDKTEVYSYPKLVTLEHLLVAMFLARAEIKKRLEDTLAKNNADVLVCRTKWQLVMLHRLLFDFVPTLMHLGISVRRCYWEGRATNTGDWVRQLLSDCLTFLVAVDNRGSSEYIRSLGLTLVYWSPFHSALPAVAFVEEALEALGGIAVAVGQDAGRKLPRGQGR